MDIFLTMKLTRDDFLGNFFDIDTLCDATINPTINKTLNHPASYENEVISNKPSLELWTLDRTQDTRNVVWTLDRTQDTRDVVWTLDRTQDTRDVVWTLDRTQDTRDVV